MGISPTVTTEGPETSKAEKRHNVQPAPSSSRTAHSCNSHEAFEGSVPDLHPPVYSEYNGHGHGLAYGHGHNNVAYNQGFANSGYVNPVKPGHVFTGYPSYSQGHHAVHHQVHAVHRPVHQVSHPVGQYTGSHQHHQNYPGVGQQLPYHPTQYLDSRYPGLGLKTANKSE